MKPVIIIVFLVWTLVLMLHERFVFIWDRRNYEGERYVEFCSLLYQQPHTGFCIEVPR